MALSKKNPITGLDRPSGFQEVEAPRFLDIWHMKAVRLSALCTGWLTPQKVFLVLISVRGWVDPRVIVWPEGLCQWKISVILWKQPTLCLNQLCQHVPPLYTWVVCQISGPPVWSHSWVKSHLLSLILKWRNGALI
jgi:hypothetical protein